MIKKAVTSLLSLLLILASGIASLSGCFSEKKQRVLLISIDGLRSDAIEHTDYGNYLIKNSAYSLNVTTVNPSLTLPCHMSMFHSVTSDVHGVIENVYTPSESLGKGITEALLDGGKTSAMFYNWKELESLVTQGSTEKNCYIPGETEGWERANQLVSDACIAHITDEPSDFVFLYLGFLDESGHKHGWLSDEYYYALNESFKLVDNVIASAKEMNYTVIITSDHGGHDFGHGSEMKEDMTIPLFIVGDKFAKGRNLGPISILDIAPTITGLLDVATPSYWQGSAIK